MPLALRLSTGVTALRQTGVEFAESPKVLVSASGIRNSTTRSKVSVLSTLNEMKSTKYRVLSTKKIVAASPQEGNNNGNNANTIT